MTITLGIYPLNSPTNVSIGTALRSVKIPLRSSSTALCGGSGLGLSGLHCFHGCTMRPSSGTLWMCRFPHTLACMRTLPIVQPCAVRWSCSSDSLTLRRLYPGFWAYPVDYFVTPAYQLFAYWHSLLTICTTFTL